MSTTGNMKKFGRGYVLDFTALMSEVRSPNQKPPDDITHSTSATATPTTFPATYSDVSDSSGQHYATINTDRDSGFGDNRVASGADATPSPTDDDPLESTGQGMNRKATRMSVSRTGRLKNRDRQRISVLQTTEFYGAKPNTHAPPPLPPPRSIPAPGHHPTVRDANAGGAGGLPNDTLADFDGVIAGLDSGSGGGIPTQHIKKTDCYSF